MSPSRCQDLGCRGEQSSLPGAVGLGHGEQGLVRHGQERLTVCRPGEEQGRAQCQGCDGGGHARSASSADTGLGEQDAELCSVWLLSACFSPGGWLLVTSRRR